MSAFNNEIGLQFLMYRLSCISYHVPCVMYQCITFSSFYYIFFNVSFSSLNTSGIYRLSLL